MKRENSYYKYMYIERECMKKGVSKRIEHMRNWHGIGCRRRASLRASDERKRRSRCANKKQQLACSKVLFYYGNERVEPRWYMYVHITVPCCTLEVSLIYTGATKALLFDCDLLRDAFRSFDYSFFYSNSFFLRLRVYTRP